MLVVGCAFPVAAGELSPDVPFPSSAILPSVCKAPAKATHTSSHYTCNPQWPSQHIQHQRPIPHKKARLHSNIGLHTDNHHHGEMWRKKENTCVMQIKGFQLVYYTTSYLLIRLVWLAVYKEQWKLDADNLTESRQTTAQNLTNYWPPAGTRYSNSQKSKKCSLLCPAYHSNFLPCQCHVLCIAQFTLSCRKQPLFTYELQLSSCFLSYFLLFSAWQYSPNNIQFTLPRRKQ